MEINPDPGPMRDKPIVIKPVPAIKVSRWRRIYEIILKAFITLFRALSDSREATRDKGKEFQAWVKRIIELILTLGKFKS